MYCIYLIKLPTQKNWPCLENETVKLANDNEIKFASPPFPNIPTWSRSLELWTTRFIHPLKYLQARSFCIPTYSFWMWACPLSNIPLDICDKFLFFILEGLLFFQKYDLINHVLKSGNKNQVCTQKKSYIVYVHAFKTEELINTSDETCRIFEERMFDILSVIKLVNVRSINFRETYKTLWYFYYLWF